MDIGIRLSHYKRKDIQDEIIANAQDREVAIKFGENGFGKRPDVLKYPRDILELAKQGATSFHASEELWRNPLQLGQDMKKHDIERLRHGWDLVLDIDCHFIEYSKIAADMVIKALKFHKINSISCKFSGNKGFHIGVPFEAFPQKVNGIDIRLLFPDAARRIAMYLKEMIKKPVGEKIMQLEKNDFSSILKKTGAKEKDVIDHKKDDIGVVRKHLNAEAFLDIDTILISSRHLYRMPYSFNEKSGLVSVVINPDKVMLFHKGIAKPENARISRFRFLDRKNVIKNEARQLIVQAYDFEIKKPEEEKETKEFQKLESAVPEQFFPPCINDILKGLVDGRKRSVFVLLNFLTSCGWSYEMIEKKLEEWNKRNNEALRDVTIKGQLNYHKQKKSRILPPNCQNLSYYKDFGVCKPDNLCQRIKNPVNYAIVKTRYLNDKDRKKNKKESQNNADST